jgi:hypothetical protein
MSSSSITEIPRREPGELNLPARLPVVVAPFEPKENGLT